MVGGQQQFLRTSAGGALLKEIQPSVAIRRKHNAAVIRRPDRVVVGAGREREPAARSSRGVENPDVALIVLDALRHGDALQILRQRGVVVVGRRGGGSNLFSGPIEPDKLSSLA